MTAGTARGSRSTASGWRKAWTWFVALAVMLAAAPASAAPPPAGTHTLVAVLVSDKAHPAADQGRVRARLREAGTYWTTQLPGVVAGFETARPRHLVVPDACRASFPALWRSAAKTLGLEPGPREHVVVVRPTSCDLMGPVGEATDGRPGAGGWVGVGWWESTTLVHELGHNLGLGHASAERSGRRLAYGGDHSPMSAASGHLTDLDVGVVAALGAARPGMFREVGLDGRRIALAPVGGRKGLRAVTFRGARTGRAYWVEYRDGRGGDAGADYAGAGDTGVRVYVVEGTSTTTLESGSRLATQAGSSLRTEDFTLEVRRTGSWALVRLRPPDAQPVSSQVIRASRARAPRATHTLETRYSIRQIASRYRG